MATRELGLGDYWKSLYQYDLFTNKFNFRHLVLYVLLLFILEIAVGYFFSSFVLQNDIARSWLQSAVGIPVLLFLVYALFNIVLNAFGPTKKSFTEGFLVFASISFAYLIIVQLLTIINVMIQSVALSTVIGLILLLMLLYYVVVLILVLKNYYGTNWQRVLVSFVFVDIIIGMALVFSALGGALY